MDKFYWIEENGTEHLLMDENYMVLDDISGRFMPPINVIEEEVPFQPGTRRRSVKVKSRDVDISLLLKANSEVNLKQLIRKTLSMFNPLKLGKLRSISSDGVQRELNCQYIGGLEGKESADTNGFYLQNLILVFRAFDPFWYDANVIVNTFTSGQSAKFFPFFPLRFSSSSVFASFSINNNGDVETWPEIIITGPGENIILSNQSTGEIMNLDHTDAVLLENENIIINTKPFIKTVLKNDSTNIFHALTDESSLWSLQEGFNNIKVEMSNATDKSKIQISYQPRYWGP